jgi:aminoglycoside phosphotransferase (APT) family kinase protein
VDAVQRIAGGEIAVDPALVARLLLAQAPELATMTPRPTTTAGSSNWVFRLGDQLAVRLPRASYAADLTKEAHWVPRLGPALPVAVPEVIFVGEPSEIFPRPWAVVSWLTGAAPTRLDAAAQSRLARSLGLFTRALHAVDTFGLPSGAEHWGYRAGEPVTDTIDAWVDEAAHRLADLFVPERTREAWRRLREVPPAAEAACWVHTDLSAENLLVDWTGELVGVIDGSLGVGDPSVDLLYRMGTLRRFGA